MTKLTLIGIDPGIRDTGLVCIRLDTRLREWSVTARVWSGVTTTVNQSIFVDGPFLEELGKFFDAEILRNGTTFTGIEGYRPRGKDKKQDLAMSFLIQQIRINIKGSQIIDNTGLKAIVTQDMLKLWQVARFGLVTNHADLKSAARVALGMAFRSEALNPIVSEFIEDSLYGTEAERWSLVYM